jgi:hypothetical protein
VSKYHFKNFPGASPRTPIQRAGREGREGRGNREGRKGEGMGWEGKGGSIPQIKFYDYSTVSDWAFKCSSIIRGGKQSLWRMITKSDAYKGNQSLKLR